MNTTLSGMTIVLAALVFSYVTWQRDKRGDFCDEFTAEPSVGLRAGESVIGHWNAVRYFGKLAPGTHSLPHQWLWVVVRNLISDSRLALARPTRLVGAPLQVRLTDRRRLVVSVARDWGSSPRPRATRYGRGRRSAFNLLAEADAASVSIARPEREPGRHRPPGVKDGQWEVLVLRGLGPEALMIWMTAEDAASLRAAVGQDPAQR